MRQERIIQATIFEVFAEHEIGRELKAISQWLDEHRALLGLVVSDLRRHRIAGFGAGGPRNSQRSRDLAASAPRRQLLTAEPICANHRQDGERPDRHWWSHTGDHLQPGLRHPTGRDPTGRGSADRGHPERRDLF